MPPTLPQGPARILFLDHTASLGGGEIALFNLVCALDPARYVPVVLLFAEGPLAEKLRAASIETHILALDPAVASARKDSLGAGSLLKIGRSLRSLAFTRRLAREIRRLRPRIVHTNSLKSDLLGGLAARLARVPCVWHIRDRIADDYLPKKVAAFFRRAARHIPTHVVAISHSVLDSLQLPATHSKDNCRARVIHDGIPDPYATSPPKAPAMPAPHPPIVGILGRISPWKGQHVFLQAAAEVLRQFPGTRYQIIGGALFAEHDYEKKLHDTAAELHLDGAVEFLGFRPPADIPQLIAGLDILVHASTIGEPFGQVIVEGMIAAKPVIATRGGGVPEIIAAGTGVLVPMNDAPALAAALAELLADPALRGALGQRARRHVLDHFTIHHTAARVQSLYDTLLSRRG